LGFLEEILKQLATHSYQDIITSYLKKGNVMSGLRTVFNGIWFWLEEFMPPFIAILTVEVLTKSSLNS